MRPRARVLTVTALTGVALGAAASAALADPSAEVVPAAVAPGGTVTVSVTCEPTGGPPPATVQASSDAFEQGTVTLKLLSGASSGAAPVYSGTARVSGTAAGSPAPAVLGNCPAATDGPGNGPGDGWAAVFSVSARTAPRAMGAQAAAAPATADPLVGDVQNGGALAPDTLPLGGDALGGTPQDPAPLGPETQPLDPVAPESPAVDPLVPESPAADPLQEPQSAAPLGKDQQDATPRPEETRRSDQYPKEREDDDEHGRDPRGDHRTRGPATVEHGTHAGEGGAFTDSVPALVAGGLLIAGAVGAAVHRLRRGASWSP
jgi:hypothetical protein